jgi:hypothetical protein
LIKKERCNRAVPVEAFVTIVHTRQIQVLQLNRRKISAVSLGLLGEEIRKQLAIHLADCVVEPFLYV